MSVVKNSKESGMEAHCSKGIEIKTKTSVSLVVVFSDQHCKFELEAVSMSETVKDIIVRVLTKMAEKRHIPDNDYTRINDPELLALSILSPKIKREENMPPIIILSSEDQSQTLGNFLSVEYGDSNLMSPIKLWLQGNWNRYVKTQTEMLEEGYYADEELDVECIFNVQRPEVLAENKKALRVLGRLRVYFQDQNGITGCRLVDYLGGLRCEPKDVVNFTTTAKRVLLVFSEQNLQCMEVYYNDLDKDISINPKDEVLILLVTWDKLSYWLLRMLRESIGSQVPIIAFTDADVHDLELLTFLDTPPQKVSEHYGWNDCADLCGSLVDVVNIKWAGVRPSEDRSPSARVQAIPDYDNICDFLELQGKWPLELQYFRRFRFYRKCLSTFDTKSDIQTLSSFSCKEYIPHKVKEEDWI